MTSQKRRIIRWSTTDNDLASEVRVASQAKRRKIMSSPASSFGNEEAFKQPSQRIHKARSAEPASPQEEQPPCSQAEKAATAVEQMYMAAAQRADILLSRKAAGRTAIATEVEIRIMTLREQYIAYSDVAKETEKANDGIWGAWRVSSALTTSLRTCGDADVLRKSDDTTRCLGEQWFRAVEIAAAVMKRADALEQEFKTACLWGSFMDNFTTWKYS